MGNYGAEEEEDPKLMVEPFSRVWEVLRRRRRAEGEGRQSLHPPPQL